MLIQALLADRFGSEIQILQLVELGRRGLGHRMGGLGHRMGRLGQPTERRFGQVTERRLGHTRCRPGGGRRQQAGCGSGGNGVSAAVGLVTALAAGGGSTEPVTEVGRPGRAASNGPRGAATGSGLGTEVAPGSITGNGLVRSSSSSRRLSTEAGLITRSITAGRGSFAPCPAARVPAGSSRGAPGTLGASARAVPGAPAEY